MTEAQELLRPLRRPRLPGGADRARSLHRVLAHPPLQPHVWGGKGVGSQGDGTAQFVARSAADQTGRGRDARAGPRGLVPRR